MWHFHVSLTRLFFWMNKLLRTRFGECYHMASFHDPIETQVFVSLHKCSRLVSIVTIHRRALGCIEFWKTWPSVVVIQHYLINVWSPKPMLVHSEQILVLAQTYCTATMNSDSQMNRTVGRSLTELNEKHSRWQSMKHLGWQRMKHLGWKQWPFLWQRGPMTMCI